MPLRTFAGIRAVAFDLDGTIYYGSRLIDGAKQTVEYVRSTGRKVFFLTNNSTKTRRQIYEKLLGMGIECAPEDVYSSGSATAEYVSNLHLSDVYVCGSKDLREEFVSQGVTLADAESAQNLVIGFDPNFGYQQMTEGLRVAKKANLMISCNLDRSFPGEGGLLFPGCGGMVGAIEFSSGRKSDIVVGKPNRYMIDLIGQRYSLRSDEILVVGDNYESDILMAKANESPSVLIGSKYHSDTVCIREISDLKALLP